MDFEELREQSALEDDILSENEKSHLLRAIKSVVASAGIAVVIFLIVTMIYRPAVTKGGSMEPTLLDEDRCMIQVLNYTPRRGDIVVTENPQYSDKYIVKRIIAIEGDILDIDADTGDVLINGKIIDEPYIKEQTISAGNIEYPVLVPDGMVFLMGDNRNNSTDSRQEDTGMIKYENIVGKLVFRFYPFDRITWL